MNNGENQRKRRLLALLAGSIVLLIAGYLLLPKGSIEFENNSTSGDDSEMEVVTNKAASVTTESGGTTAEKKTTLSPTKRVRILSPNGGEVWQRTKQYLVRWDTNLTSAATARVYLLKTSSILSNPYADPNVAGTEVFAQAVFPKGSAPEGTFTYKVPQSLTPGKYQLLIFAGQECSFSFPKPAKVCDFDLSDGLITIK